MNPFAESCLPACRAGKDALSPLYLRGWQAHERVSDSMRDSDGILEVFAMHLAHLLHAASQCGSHFLPCIWMPVLATESASRFDCAASCSGCLFDVIRQPCWRQLSHATSSNTPSWQAMSQKQPADTVVLQPWAVKNRLSFKMFLF